MLEFMTLGTRSLIVLGDFNPAIFHPAWIARHGLLQQDEIDRAEVELVSREATIFSVGWARFEVTSARMALTTTTEAPTAEPLRDLGVAILSLLEHTPVRAFGLNHEAFYKLGTEAEWHELGFKLVPRANWEGMLDSPGLAVLTVQGRRQDYPGAVNVTVSPNSRFEHGVLVSVNDHFQLGDPTDAEDVKRAGDVVQVIEETWPSSAERASRIFDQVLEWDVS